jgi:hypothetical protein
MVIEKNWSPFYGDWNFLVAIRVCHMFLESLRRGLSKNKWHAFLSWSPLDSGGVSDGDQIFLITIKFSRNLIHPQHWMATEIFHSPKRACGRWFFFKNDITCGPPFKVTEKFQLPSDVAPPSDGNRKGRNMCHHFGGKKNHSPFYISGDQRISITIQ